jgi:hypothetical protein
LLEVKVQESSVELRAEPMPSDWSVQV